MHGRENIFSGSQTSKRYITFTNKTAGEYYAELQLTLNANATSGNYVAAQSMAELSIVGASISDITKPKIIGPSGSEEHLVA